MNVPATKIDENQQASPLPLSAADSPVVEIPSLNSLLSRARLEKIKKRQDDAQRLDNAIDEHDDRRRRSMISTIYLSMQGLLAECVHEGEEDVTAASSLPDLLASLDDLPVSVIDDNGNDDDHDDDLPDQSRRPTRQ